MSTLSSSACCIYLLVNFATDSSKILNVFESNVSEGVNPLSFSNQDECGASRFVRIANAFTDNGSDRASVASHFHKYLDDKNCGSKLVTFRGHRVNMLFQDEEATYHHLEDIQGIPHQMYRAQSPLTVYDV